MGAWIETVVDENGHTQTEVAPHVGAWIETLRIETVWTILLSHPTWVRGLKRYRNKLDQRFYQSHPTWVRGLKPYFITFTYNDEHVAPHVGAWIETSSLLSKLTL